MGRNNRKKAEPSTSTAGKGMPPIKLVPPGPSSSPAAPAVQSATPAAAGGGGQRKDGDSGRARAAVSNSGQHGAHSSHAEAANPNEKIGKNGTVSKHDNGNSVKTWSSLFKENRSSTTGASLIRVTDGVTVDKIIFQDSEFEDDCPVSRSLIGFFSPKFPGIEAVNTLAANWKHKCTVARHTSSWIVFTFTSRDEAWDVLEGGPYMSFGSILHLREMPKFFNFGREQQRTIPVWVPLHNLPLELWKPKHLAKLCSFIGRPMHTDQLTSKMERISFARCLIEIDVNKELPPHLIIDLPNGSTLTQTVLYENKPLSCEKCNRLGHATASCRDSGEPKLYVMRKPTKTVEKPSMNKKVTKKKTTNPATAPTDVWVEVGRKKTTDDSSSGAAPEANATAAAFVAVTKAPPPTVTDRVMTQEEEEAALDETTEYEGTDDDDCDDLDDFDDEGDDAGIVGEDHSDDPGDKDEEGSLVMAQQPLPLAFSTYPTPPVKPIIPPFDRHKSTRSTRSKTKRCC